MPKKGFFPAVHSIIKNILVKQLTFAEAIGKSAEMLLFDPQTSGGLLLGVPQEKLTLFKKRAEELNQPIWVVGEVRAGQGSRFTHNVSRQCGGNCFHPVASSCWFLSSL